MLYLDYSRKARRVGAQRVRRPGEPGGHRVPAGGERDRLQAPPRRRHDRRGVHRLAGRHPPHRPRAGSGFGFKWNMGWMHDTLLYIAKDPIYRQHHHHQMTFALVYAWSENYVLPISHDEVVHGKGSLAGKMPGDHVAAAGQRAGPAGVHVGAPRQAAALHGLRAGRRPRSGARSAASTGTCCTTRPAPVCSASSADLNRVYRDTPALWAQDTEPAGFRWIAGDDVANNTVSFVRIAPDGATAGLRRELLRPAAARTTGSACRPAGTLAGGAQHRRRTTTAARAWATWARYAPRTCRGTACAASAALQVPPLGALWLRQG